jgi:hypothetical protein
MTATHQAITPSLYHNTHRCIHHGYPHLEINSTDHDWSAASMAESLHMPTVTDQ